MTDTISEEQFLELIPYYLSGTLSPAEQARMDAYLDAHPSAQETLQVERCLQAVLNADRHPEEVERGLPELLLRIRQTRPRPERREQIKFSARLGAWLADLLAVPKPALLAGMAAVLLLQSSVLSYLYLYSPAAPLAEFRSPVNPTATAQGPVLEIAFRSNTTEHEMRLLLVKINGKLVGGPGQLGNYLVKVPRDQMEAVKAELAAQSIVKSAELLPATPEDR